MTANVQHLSPRGDKNPDPGGDRPPTKEQLDDAAIVELIAQNPGIKTPSLIFSSEIPSDRVQSALQRLQRAGKIEYRGWQLLSPTGDKKPDQPSPTGDKKPLLRVRWKPRAHSQGGDVYRYAYLYEGNSQVLYIGGPHHSQKVKDWVSWIERWIALGFSKDAIVERVPLLKGGRWKGGG